MPAVAELTAAAERIDVVYQTPAASQLTFAGQAICIAPICPVLPPDLFVALVGSFARCKPEVSPPRLAAHIVRRLHAPEHLPAKMAGAGLALSRSGLAAVAANATPNTSPPSVATNLDRSIRASKAPLIRSGGTGYYTNGCGSGAEEANRSHGSLEPIYTYNSNPLVHLFPAILVTNISSCCDSSFDESKKNCICHKLNSFGRGRIRSCKHILKMP